MTNQVTPTSDDALAIAKRAIGNGDLHVARKVLLWIIQGEPRNVPARLLLAQSVEEDQKAKIALYSQIVEIEPDNETAKIALAKHGASLPPARSPRAAAADAIQRREFPPSTELEIISPVEESEDEVAAKLDVARRDLLDMGMRNKLLNYRPLKSKGAEVIDEKSAEVYRILVSEGRSMSFLPVSEENEDKDGAQGKLDLEDAEEGLAQPDQSEEKDPGRYTDDKLQTGYTSKVLQRRLLNSYHAANTYIKEQGVNILFIALGLLKWYESESSSEPRRAPLALVPVTLSRSSVKAKFRVRYTEEDIVENLSLSAKMNNDFGIELPEFPKDDLAPADYFTEVSEVIRAYERWDVEQDAVALGFFSYGKFLMFNDLRPEEWPENLQPDDHEILNGLLHDGFDDGLDYLDDDTDIDEIISLNEVHHVMDADSSQILAINDVSRGRNLVIQGPPGTGKSQTIANLIAEAIGHGKTVLFVSAKMAALDVVKRRLDSVGLGDACLELHSQKTKKKLVIEELKRASRLGQPANQKYVDMAELKRNQDRLNSYSRAVNDEIGESGVTPYEAYGRLIGVRKKLSGLTLPDLKLDGMQDWNRGEFEEARSVARELEILLRRMGRPADHPFWCSTILKLLPADKTRILSALAAALQSLTKLSDAVNRLSKYTKVQKLDTSVEAKMHALSAEYFLTMPDISGTQVLSDAWVPETNRLGAALEAGIKIRRIRRKYGPYLKNEAWNADVSELYFTMQGYTGKFWRRLSPTFRKANRSLETHLRSGPPTSIEGRLELLRAIIERRKLLADIKKFEEKGPALFGERWRGENSDWDDLIDIANWLNEVHTRVESGKIDSYALDFISSDPKVSTLKDRLVALADALEDHNERLDSLISLLKLKETARFGKDGSLANLEFAQQEKLLQYWETEIDRLQEIAILGGLAQHLENRNLIGLFQISTRWAEAKDHLMDLLLDAWHTELLQRAMTERPALASFDGELHENAMSEFCKLDLELLARNRNRLAYEHWKALPKHQAGGNLGVLRHEFAKKGKSYLPIRKLIAKTGRVIQCIKPVLMMSPLSIAQFLKPGSIDFDLVIFDEASQVKPVDAFGAILRGRQLVVVGDDRQLPPTTFFESAIDVEEDYSDSPTVDLESILGLCSAKAIPHRMLRWHYRSQHESLITVSNKEFYDHRLIVFPSPDKDKSELGLIYNYLPETTYDRGGSRTNLEEAREVASAVMRHAARTPELTLGVATFSRSQMDAIIHQLEFLRSEDPSSEDFFRDHPEEEFFVKNLENVQGDERDVIFISVGYGRQADGRVAMSFGPLNMDGGERRLNVLITRARKRCEIFTNLRAGDIDLARTPAFGVRVLKEFLSYAETGIIDLPVITGKDPESPFEESVASELQLRGHRVEHQIGAGGFFIDLAIVDPEHPGSYLLGIECDGATYHSARSARDRDRIRQEQLERLGWQIHRIWSTDWFRNPTREIGRLEQSIAQAKQVSNQAGANRASPKSSRQPQATEIERYQGAPSEQPAIKVSAYKTARVSNSAYKYRLHEVAARTMADWIAQVVEIESPVHEDEVARRIVNSAGVKRLGQRIRAAYASGLAAASGKGTVTKKKSFLWLPNMRKPKLRSRAELPSASRKLELVAPEEIELAIVEVIKASFGIEREDIPSEACSLFGFQRVTKLMNSIIMNTVTRMLRNGIIMERGGNLELPE